MSNISPKRELNLLHTISLIVGAVIGSGVFLNIPKVLGIAGDQMFSYIIWLVAGILWIPQILILAEMGTAYPDQGGPYLFLHKAGSPLLGFMYTWTAFLTSDTPTLTIIGLMAASALKIIFPVLGDDIISKIFAGILILGFGMIQIRSVKTGGNIQIILTISKLLPLIGVVILGGIYFNCDNMIIMKPSIQNGLSISEKLTSGISATIWAYAGFLNILYMSGEVKNPTKNLPKALIGSLLFVILSYVLISMGTGSLVPVDDIVNTSGNEFINPFKYIRSLSNIAGEIFGIIFFISMIGVLNSTVMTQPRLEYATARDGLFFKSFGKLHPKFLTPSFSIIVQVIFSIILFLLGNIENIIGYFTLSYVLQNAFVYGAIFFLRKKEDYKPTFKLTYWKTAAALAILTQLYIIYGTFLAFPIEGVLASIGLILSGLPAYIIFRKKSKNK